VQIARQWLEVAWLGEAKVVGCWIMAAKTVSNDRSASTRESVDQQNAPKSYRSPSLAKGPTLSAVTAEGALSSGAISNDSINTDGN
jgi:hypothetical protein